MPDTNNPMTGGATATGASASTQNLENSKQHLRDAASDLRSNLESSKTHVKQAAEEFRAAASATAEDLRGRAEHAYSDARDRARTLQEDGEQYVRQNPTKAVLTALAAGFVLGVVFRR